MGPSTRAFRKEAGRTANYTWFDFVHAYVYGRWPYFYISVATGEHFLAKLLGPLVKLIPKVIPPRSADDGERVEFADTYHGKVVPLDAARQLVTVKQEITLTNLEHIIPYKRARDIVFQNPDHIVVLECPCRSSRPNPCLPLDVCLVIGEPFAGFIMEHNPDRARRITPEEAEAILVAEHDRGHVSHAFFKDAMFNRFYAICNCCSCCCGAMSAHRNGIPMLASSGYVARVDDQACTGCGLCVTMCQFGAVSLAEQGAATVDWASCMGCGVCVHNCPAGVVTLLRDQEKGEPLEIRRLMEEAAACN